MLTEFEGTIDAQGLRTFKRCSGNKLRLVRRKSPSQSSNCVTFWAVVESQSAVRISDELNFGSTARAMRLLEELALSLGRMLD